MTGLLTSRRASLLVVAAGVVLTAPSLTNGVCMDDRIVRAMAQGYAPIQREPWDLFHFISDEPVERQRLLDLGWLPWFTAEHNRAAFFRPLSSLSAWVDYRVLPQWPWLFHLENVALFGALVALALALYRALLPSPAAAALAGLMFAVDDAHGVAVGWLSNRSALLASVFGLAALLLHHRGALGSRAGQWLAPVALAVALCCGELALGAAAYLAAYVLVLDERSARTRGSSALPYGVVLLGWAMARSALRYGVADSEFYVDPGHEPLRFLLAVPGRLLALTVAQLWPVPSDLFVFWKAMSPAALAALVTAAIALLALLVRVAWPTLRASRPARFFALGMMLALFPIAAVLPSDRNLVLAGVGAFGLLASLEAPRWLRRAIVGVHVVLAALMLPAMALAVGLIDRFTLAGTAYAREAAAGQTIVQLNTTNVVMTAFYLATPDGAAARPPARVRSLASAEQDLAVTREDEHTLLLTMAAGHFIDPTAAIVRSRANPLRPGDRVELPGLTYAVVRVDERGAPLELRCRFDVPLEDASLRWVQWDGAQLIPFQPPAIGQTARIAR